MDCRKHTKLTDSFKRMAKDIERACSLSHGTLLTGDEYTHFVKGDDVVRESLARVPDSSDFGYPLESKANHSPVRTMTSYDLLENQPQDHEDHSSYTSNQNDNEQDDMLSIYEGESFEEIEDPKCKNAATSKERTAMKNPTASVENTTQHPKPSRPKKRCKNIGSRKVEKSMFTTTPPPPSKKRRVVVVQKKHKILDRPASASSEVSLYSSTSSSTSSSSSSRNTRSPSRRSRHHEDKHEDKHIFPPYANQDHRYSQTLLLPEQKINVLFKPPIETTTSSPVEAHQSKIRSEIVKPNKFHHRRREHYHKRVYHRIPESIVCYENYLLKLISNCSPRLTFIHANVKNGICSGFAITSLNNMYEGVGVAYDLTKRKNLNSSERLVDDHRPRTRRWLPNAMVNPEDITRFLASNVDFPVVVGCEYDNLLSLDGSKKRLLDDYCHLTNLRPGSVTSYCYYCKRRASYVSARYKTPLCSLHANTFEGRLQLYQPSFVAIEGQVNRLKMYTLLYDPSKRDPLLSAQWILLASRRLRNCDSPGKTFTTQTGHLKDIAHSLGWEWRSDLDMEDDPLNVVKTLQNMCLVNSLNANLWQI